MQHLTSTIDDVLDTLLLQRTPPNILLGEDDDAMRSLIGTTLRASGYRLIEAQSGLDLIRSIHRIGAAMLPLDLIITDLQMPGFNGLEVLEYLRYSGWQVPVVVMSGFGDTQLRREARHLDACFVLDKPFDIHGLLSTVSRIVPPRRPSMPRPAPIASA